MKTTVKFQNNVLPTILYYIANSEIIGKIYELEHALFAKLVSQNEQLDAIMSSLNSNSPLEITSKEDLEAGQTEIQELQSKINQCRSHYDVVDETYVELINERKTWQDGQPVIVHKEYTLDLPENSLELKFLEDVRNNIVVGKTYYKDELVDISENIFIRYGLNKFYPLKRNIYYFVLEGNLLGISRTMLPRRYNPDKKSSGYLISNHMFHVD